MPLLDRDRVANLNSLVICPAPILLPEGEWSIADVPIRDEWIVKIVERINTSDLTK